MRPIARITLAFVVLVVGLPAQAQDAETLWSSAGENVATPSLENLPVTSSVQVETPLPDGSNPRWNARRTAVPGGFRLTSRQDTDYLVLTVTEVVTGVVGVGGAHYVVSGDNEGIRIEETAPFNEQMPLQPPHSEGGQPALATDGVLDVLVLYTPAAAAEAGGTSAIEQSLSDFMTATQGYFDAGAVGVTSALAGVEAVSDTEAPDILRTLVELTFLEGSSDYLFYDPGADVEKFDEAHCRRGETGADLVMLVTGEDDTGTAGIAWILTEDLADRDFAYAVTEWAFGPLVFAHELGHLLGNDHDLDNDLPGAARAPYAHGYRVPGVARTIMAYPCEFQGQASCPAVGIFSDPDIEIDGNSMGHPATADASGSLAESWEDYAGWAYNNPPAVGDATVTTDTSDFGRYVLTVEGRDTTSCSGILRVNPGNDTPIVTENWSSSAAPFQVELDLRYTEPASVAIGACLQDVQGIENCLIDPPIEVDVCHASGFFGDVSTESQFDEDIGWLACQKITRGFPDGGFHPSDPITRAAMAPFIYRMEGEPEFTPPVTASFTDVPTTHPFFEEIEWLVSEGITTGFPDGTYRPGADVSRMAMAAFIYRMEGEPEFTPPVTASFTDVPTTHPFFEEIEWLVSEGITTGFADGTFRPNLDIARRGMAAFLHRVVVSG